MDQKHAIIKGAFILTLTGFATRFIGFFYRIFLSQSFGEESVGLYQLIFPVYALCFSLCCAGIETAVARNVAASSSLGDKKKGGYIFILWPFFIFPPLLYHDASYAKGSRFYRFLLFRRTEVCPFAYYHLLRHALCRCPQLHMRVLYRIKKDKDTSHFTAG